MTPIKQCRALRTSNGSVLRCLRIPTSDLI